MYLTQFPKNEKYTGWTPKKRNHDRNMVEINNIWHVVNAIANEGKNKRYIGSTKINHDP